ncbi:MAG: sigma-70 family RNA polymerase sigma factor [Planctomycetota bacterium]
MSSSPPPSLAALLNEREWVRSLARRLVGSVDEAEELAQDVLLRALEAPPRQVSALRAWLGVVTRHRAHERRRTAPVVEELVGDAAAADEATVLETVERAEAHQAVVDAVMALAEPYRATVLLRYFEGRTPTEIAGVQGVPVATVASRLTRAHARLRERLGDGSGDRPSVLSALAPLVATSGQRGTSTSVPIGPILIMSTSLKVAAAVGVALGCAFFGLVWLRGEAPGRHEAVQMATSPPKGPSPTDEQLANAEESPGTRAAIAEPTAGPEETAAEADEPASELSGHVLLEDGTPASGAVVVQGGFGSLQFLEDQEGPPEELITAVADEAGRFAFPAVPESRVLLTAGRADQAPSLSIVWEPGDPRFLELRLRQGVRIYGIVHRSDGALARGRRVRLLQDASSIDPLGGRLRRFTTTDDQGAFDESGLCPGEWGLVTYPDEAELAEIGGSMVDHMVQATVQLSDGQEAHVPLGGKSPEAVRVRGRVTLGGEPARGILQWMREGPDPMGSQRNVEMKSDGRYEIELEGPGTWYVRVMGVSSGEFFPTIPPLEEATQDFQLPTGKLTGDVRLADGKPLKDARVSLQVAQGAYERGGMRIAGDSARSDEAGRFHFDGLASGDYLVGAVHPEMGIATSAVVSVQADSAGGTRGRPVELTVRGSHSISGTILGPEGFPALLAPVWIYDESGRLLNPIARRGATNGGRFETPPLPPGRYSLLSQSRLDVALVAGIVVADEPVKDLRLELKRGATITVRTLLNQVSQRAHVQVLDESGRCLTGQRDLGNPWQWRRHPFHSKNKRVGPFPPGTYVVRSHVPGLGTAEEKITLVETENAEVEIHLD